MIDCCDAEFQKSEVLMSEQGWTVYLLWVSVSIQFEGALWHRNSGEKNVIRFSILSKMYSCTVQCDRSTPPPKKKWNWFIATYGTAKKYISLSIYLSVSLCVLHSPWYVGSNAHFAQPQSKCRYCLFRDLKITRGASPGTFDVHLFRFYLYYLYYIVIQNNNVRNCCQLQLSTLLRYVFLLF
jgi:hypothetical protein